MAGARTYLKLAGLATLTWLLPVSEGTYCEPKNITICNQMPYTDIQMPNLLYHSTQENARLVLEQYSELIKTDCSDVLVFYLCAMFAPICPIKFNQDRIPPCRAVCEKARQGCEHLMLRYNVSWPRELACDGLPVYERGMCIEPGAIETGSTTVPPPTIQKNSTKGYAKGCKCKNRTTISARDAYLKNRLYDYAMKVEFLSAKGVKRGPVELSVRVIKVIKQGQVAIKRGDLMTLRNENGCVCPRMVAGRKYVIMGHEDRRLKQLYYNVNSVAGRWKKKWNKSLDKWKKKGTDKKDTIRINRARKRKLKETRRSQKKDQRRKDKRKHTSHRRTTTRHKSRRKHRRLDSELSEYLNL